ncbi:MAG: hypothetical protein WDL87_02605 [Candidatus Omnitrophota bacterium]|jgi:TM2 domain-containing membrane protein YozV
MTQQNNLPHPGLAAVFSFIFNGLGQIYNGQIGKGLFIIFISALNMLVFFVGSLLIGLWLLGKVKGIAIVFLGTSLFIVGLSLICVVGIFSIYDAYKVAIEKK